MTTLNFNVNMSLPATPYVSDTLQGGKTIAISFPEGKRSPIFVQESSDGSSWKSKQSISAAASASFDVAADAASYLRVLVSERPASASYQNYSSGGGGGGGITTETDPTVPSWAKQTNKPAYTASEITDGNSNVSAKLATLSSKCGEFTTEGHSAVCASIESIESQLSGVETLLASI